VNPSICGKGIVLGNFFIPFGRGFLPRRYIYFFKKNVAVNDSTGSDGSDAVSEMEVINAEN
jgi:hypothetical protein